MKLIPGAMIKTDISFCNQRICRKFSKFSLSEFHRVTSLNHKYRSSRALSLRVTTERNFNNLVGLFLKIRICFATSLRPEKKRSIFVNSHLVADAGARKLVFQLPTNLSTGENRSNFTYP